MEYETQSEFFEDLEDAVNWVLSYMADYEAEGWTVENLGINLMSDSFYTVIAVSRRKNAIL